MRVALKVTTASLLMLGCMKGPGFFKQGAAELPLVPAKVLVETREENGAVIGGISANSKDTQVLQASADSEIAGAAAEFPPGAVAIDTEISMKAGPTLASSDVVSQLNIGSAVTSSGAAVTISSSVAMDTAVPFTLALPLPAGGSLALDDAYANLAVLYHVNKVEAGGGDFTGVIPHDSVQISGGMARVATRFFGTYQTIITEKPITEVKEVAQAPANEIKSRIYFVKGFATSAFDDDQGQKSDGFQGWFYSMSPSRVGNAAKFTSGISSHKE